MFEKCSIKNNSMKKLLLLFTVIFISAALSAQTTATNFTCNDCAGISHTLFTELDAGEVIVLTWVMPCGACIAGASTAAATVQSHATSNPGIVKFFLVDDIGNTPCSTLTLWGNSNHIPSNFQFSNAAIHMTDYGSTGMPKTIVLGGTNHTVYYNQSGNPSASDLQAAINSALSANTGIIENNNVKMGLTVFPNPALNNTKLKYTLTKSAEINIEVMDVLGKKIKTISLGIQTAGNQEYKINLESFNNGIYFARLNAGDASEIVEVTISR